MSFKKYMESKNQQKIIVDMEKYKENLHAELSSFVMKPNKNVFEVRKKFIDNEYFRSIFSKINYPYQEKFIIALHSNDFVKITKEQDRFLFHGSSLLGREQGTSPHDEDDQERPCEKFHGRQARR